MVRHGDMGMCFLCPLFDASKSKSYACCAQGGRFAADLRLHASGPDWTACPSHQKWIVKWIRCAFYKSIATLSFEPQPWFISPPNLPVKDLEGPTPKAFPEYLPAHFDRAPVGVDPSCCWIFDEAVSMKFV